MAVILSVATWSGSLPIAFRLYLPEAWPEDPKRRQKAGILEQVQFQIKPQTAFQRIRQAVEEEVTRGVVVADAVNHAALCLAAYGFLLAERSLLSPPHKSANWSYAPRQFLPASSPAVRREQAERNNPTSIITLRLRIARLLIQEPRLPYVL